MVSAHEARLHSPPLSADGTDAGAGVSQASSFRMDCAPRTECAPRACAKCRMSKRKCDRTLPKCSRCSRLSATCAYYYMVGESQKVGTFHAALPGQADGGADAVALLGRFDPAQDMPSAQIMAILRAHETDWPAVADVFFEYVNPWLGALHPALFHRAFDPFRYAECDSMRSDSMSDEASLDRHTASPGHDPPAMAPHQALLLVMMHLATRHVPQEGPSAVFDGDYWAVKRMLALMSCEEPTVLLVQSLILLSLFEFGHGETARSYRTLGDAAMAARVLGIRPGQVDSIGTAWSNMEEEEATGIWWSMFIMDQSIHSDQTAKQLPFVIESPQPTTVLPAANISDNLRGPLSLHQNSARVPVGKAVNPNLQPIQKAAQVANILHRTLRWNQERDNPGALPAVSSFQHLDAEIRSATQTLIEDSRHWEKEIDCFSMCISALFTLYLPYVPASEEAAPLATRVLARDTTSDLACALAALQFACQISVDIACRLYDRLSRVPAPLQVTVMSAPTAATSCFLACMGFARRRLFYPEEHELLEERIHERFEGLQFFSSRWGIGEHIMRQLEARGLPRARYLKPQPPPPQQQQPDPARHGSVGTSTDTDDMSSNNAGDVMME